MGTPMDMLELLAGYHSKEMAGISDDFKNIIDNSRLFSKIPNVGAQPLNVLDQFAARDDRDSLSTLEKFYTLDYNQT